VGSQRYLPGFESVAEGYRGRLAPSPTGLLHVGHARTFWTAYTRARDAGGTLILRMDDLDAERSKPEFAEAAMEDLRWLGIRWQEGPDKISLDKSAGGAPRLSLPLPLLAQGSCRSSLRSA
jgi:glutamyl/glutaminyl-tRNA synthetase